MNWYPGMDGLTSRGEAIPSQPPVTGASTLTVRVWTMMANPKVTIARNHSFSRTQVSPIRIPMNAATAAPRKMVMNGETPHWTAIRVEAYAPMPKNAAWPSDPCPENASRFHADAKMMAMSIRTRRFRRNMLSDRNGMAAAITSIATSPYFVSLSRLEVHALTPPSPRTTRSAARRARRSG